MADAGLALLVKQIAHEADGVLSMLLTDPDGRPLPPWQPGAHLELTLPSGLIRQYSLCGDPAAARRDHYRVAVLRERAGRGGSAEIHDTGLVGRVLRARGPRNRFQLVDAPRYVFIAGGIGITPILPMVRAVAATPADWTLHYGGRTRRSMAFLDDLAAIAAAASRQRAPLNVVPEDECGLLNLQRILDDIEPGTEVYCCGPAGLIAAVELACETAGIADRLHFERFAADPDAASRRSVWPAAASAASTANGGEPGVNPSGSDAFEVELRASGLTVRVDQDESILEAVRRALPDVASSCEEGICGTCEVRVLDGTPDHRDDILSESERAAGDTMFICVSRARTPRLVIDL